LEIVPSRNRPLRPVHPKRNPPREGKTNDEKGKFREYLVWEQLRKSFNLKESAEIGIDLVLKPKTHFAAYSQNGYTASAKGLLQSNGVYLVQDGINWVTKRKRALD